MVLFVLECLKTTLICIKEIFVINLENNEKVTYSLPSVFFGLFVVVELVIYITMLCLDSVLYSMLFIYISEVMFFAINLLITYIVWESATSYSEKNTEVIWGGVAKFVVGISLLINLITLVSGYSVRERGYAIKERMFLEGTVKQVETILKLQEHTLRKLNSLIK